MLYVRNIGFNKLLGLGSTVFYLYFLKIFLKKQLFRILNKTFVVEVVWKLNPDTCGLWVVLIDFVKKILIIIILKEFLKH